MEHRVLHARNAEQLENRGPVSQPNAPSIALSSGNGSVIINVPSWMRFTAQLLQTFLFMCGLRALFFPSALTSEEGVWAFSRIERCFLPNVESRVLGLSRSVLQNSPLAFMKCSTQHVAETAVLYEVNLL